MPITIEIVHPDGFVETDFVGPDRVDCLPFEHMFLLMSNYDWCYVNQER